MPGKPLHDEVQFWRDDALPGVEARFSAYRKHAFRTHTHAEYSVGVVEQGSTVFPLGENTHSVRAGQLVLINPLEPHACNPDTSTGITYRLFYLAPGWLAGAAQTQTPPLFPRPVVDDPELFEAWRDLHLAFIATAEAGEKQARLVTCLRALVLRHAEPAPGPHPENPAVTRAQEHMADTIGQGTLAPLDDLAQVAGLSRHHFARTFKAATGLPPHAYQLQLALEHAKGLLLSGLPISQAALDAGFADQSHFSRVFRQFTGATPGQYLQAR